MALKAVMALMVTCSCGNYSTIFVSLPNNNVIVSLLWADDIILSSEKVNGLPEMLDTVET